MLLSAISRKPDAPKGNGMALLLSLVVGSLDHDGGGANALCEMQIR